MTTLKDIREQVILDAGITGNPKFQTARLNLIINQAQKYVQIQLNELGMKKWMTVTPEGITLTKGSIGEFQAYSCSLEDLCPGMTESPDSVIFVEVSYSDSVSSPAVLAREIQASELDPRIMNNFFTSPDFRTPQFARLSGRIYVFGNPESFTSYSARAYYFRNVKEMKADADASEIPDEYIKFVVRSAVLEIRNITGTMPEDEKESAEQAVENGIRKAYERFMERKNEMNNQRAGNDH